MSSCPEMQRIVWAGAGDESVGEHLASCGACRLEARRATQLRAALTHMRSMPADPPPGLEAALLQGNHATSRSVAWRARDIAARPAVRRGAAVGAAAAATAAVGLVVARRLVRPAAASA